MLKPLTSTVSVGHVREFPDVSQPDCKADQREYVLCLVGPMRALRGHTAIVTASFLFTKDPNQAQVLQQNFILPPSKDEKNQFSDHTQTDANQRCPNPVLEDRNPTRFSDPPAEKTLSNSWIVVLEDWVPAPLL